jgi:hypothetical protein
LSPAILRGGRSKNEVRYRLDPYDHTWNLRLRACTTADAHAASLNPSLFFPSATGVEGQMPSAGAGRCKGRRRSLLEPAHAASPPPLPARLDDKDQSLSRTRNPHAVCFTAPHIYRRGRGPGPVSFEFPQLFSSPANFFILVFPPSPHSLVSRRGDLIRGVNVN